MSISNPDIAPQSEEPRRDFSGVTVQVYSPPASDAATDFNKHTNTFSSSNHISSSSAPNYYSPPALQAPQRPSPLISFSSVESVPTIGTLPFGSLRINAVADDQDLADTDTPLTTPDRTRPSSGIGAGIDTTVMTMPVITGGDVFLLDDLPVGFTVGCDAASFSTGKQQGQEQSFQGFRDIPAGAHLFWVSASESSSTRSAYWIVTAPVQEHTAFGGKEVKKSGEGEVYVKQWDQFNEVLSEPASQAEERFQKEKLQQIFDSLLSYQQLPQPSTSALLTPPSGTVSAAGSNSSRSLAAVLDDGSSIWSQLTSTIHPGLLDRIIGKQQKTGWKVTTEDGVAGEPTLARESRLYGNDTQPLRFTFTMDSSLISPTATGDQRTQQALDPTAYIIEVLEKTTASPNDLAGELSFAFLTGAHLGNHALLEQWWFLATRVIFRSYNLALGRPHLALTLIQTIHLHLAYDDRHLDGPSILDTFPSQARALQRALVTYKARLDEHLLGLGDRISTAQQGVGAAFADLESWLWRFGWDLRGHYVRSGTLTLEDGEMVEADMSDFEDEDERGEFAPALVEIDGDGREAGLVSWDR